LLIETYLNFKPNHEQQAVLEDLIRFILPEDDREIMVLKGAAGTGKTSILKAITQIIKDKGVNFRLAAPTGRAAKVLYSKTQSNNISTIHSMIYLTEQMDDGRVKLTLRSENEDEHCIYIIDESSMISDFKPSDSEFVADSPLLTDLIRYVNKGDSRNKIIFVGDHYQLPPFAPMFETSKSFALDSGYLMNKFNKEISENALTKVMHQSEGSSVLNLATEIRKNISKGNSMYTAFPERNRGWWEALDMYVRIFDSKNLNKVLMVCHTNKDVNFWNNKIREKLFGRTDEILNVGDIVQLQRINWIEDGVLFNGDTGIVTEVDLNPNYFGGLHFSECEIQFESGNKTRKVKKLFCWEVLTSDYGTLKKEQRNNLFAAVMKTNPKFRTTKNITNDEYLNAFWLRHGYASSCHKAQGGEWETVFVNPYLKWMKQDKARWLYTAYTRARKNLFSWMI